MVVDASYEAEPDDRDACGWCPMVSWEESSAGTTRERTRHHLLGASLNATRALPRSGAVPDTPRALSAVSHPRWVRR